MRFRLIVVEQGTASRWWELLGSVGTHWLFLLAFCSLTVAEKTNENIFIYRYNRAEVKWSSVQAEENPCLFTWGRLEVLCWWTLPCTSHRCPRRSLHTRTPSAESHWWLKLCNHDRTQNKTLHKLLSTSRTKSASRILSMRPWDWSITGRFAIHVSSVQLLTYHLLNRTFTSRAN